MFFTTPPTQRRFDFARRTPPTLARGGWVVRDDTLMGSAVHVELWCEDRRHGAAAAAAAIDEMHRIDRTTSPHGPASELGRINRDAAQQAVPLSAEMGLLLERALNYARLSGGAFDISGTAAPRARAGWQQLEFDRDARTLRFGQPGMCIDLGGFARGHAVDRAALLLRRRGITSAIVSAIVSAGGDSRVLGSRFVGAHEQRPWSMAIRHPRRAGEVVALLPLEEVSVSTAAGEGAGQGDVAGPGPADAAAVHDRQHLHSVTVLAHDGLASDALCKAVWGLGVQRGLALVESQPGADALVVDTLGGLHVSSGLRPSLPPAGA